MPRILVPGRKPLLLPGTSKRALRRPNTSGLLLPQLSGAPLGSNDVDFDDLVIVRQWREYSPDAADQVRYFCYELVQQDPGAEQADHYFKAVRLIRLTRVPRYLRQFTTNEQFRDLLSGLREKQVLFVNLIAKSPQLPLVFAYGVQGVGESIEEAMECADLAYASLTFALDGTYQQLEYQPLTVAEGELLARYQAEWRQIAMARGRPMPENAGIGASSVLDGNRTDVQNTHDAIASFVRGMGDKSFMLSLVTVPITPEDMSHAWRNIGMKLSAVRSDQQGQRTIGASFALPLGLGTSLATGNGSTHGTTGTTGTGSSDGLSTSHTDGVSASHSDGLSASMSHGVSASHSEGTSTSHSLTASDSATHSLTDSAAHSSSVGQSLSAGQTTSTTHGTSDSVSLGHTVGTSDTHSTSETAGVTQGQSLGVSNSASSNWSNSASQSLSAGQTATDNWSKSVSDSLSQTWGLNQSSNTGANQGAAEGGSATVGGGLDALGLSSSTSQNWQNSWGGSQGTNQGSSLSQTGGGSNTTGVGSSLANSLTTAHSIGESAGGSLGQTVTGTNSVGASHSLTAGQALGYSQSDSATQGSSVSSAAGLSASLTHGASASTGVSTGQSLSTGTGQSLSAGASTGTSSSSTVGQSTTSTQGASSTDTYGASASNTAGASTGTSTQQAVSDAWMVALSRQASQTGSFGVVPGLSASISKATFDESKRALGDVLEAQMRRYHDGIEGGAMLYQMFLVTEDKETLAGAATLLKSAFWGPGGQDKGRLVQPFHTIMIDDRDEADRLLTHAAALTHYRRREPVVDLIEPHLYSSFVTTGEAAVFSSPPTSESLGLMAQVDSMPVFAMPANRGDRDLYIGHVVNGERGKVSDARFGVDLSELTHILVQGVTGMGKTSTMMRLLEQAVALKQQVVTLPTATNPHTSVREGRAGVLCFDWMNNMRDLASIVEPDRFQLFSVSKPELGAFRWNPLEIPHARMAPHQWLGAQADQLAASAGLGEFGRSLIAEHIDRLYLANRLEPFVLRERQVDQETGAVLREEIVLPAVNRADLPAGAIALDAAGNEVANVYSCPELSRLVSLQHLAVLVVALVERMATPEGAREMGTSMRDRVQSLWRRMQYYAPGGPLADMVAADPDLRTRQCLGVRDLIDPDRGLVTVIETDGLDQSNRRIILGSVMLAIYRYGLHVGKGAFDNGGRGPGTFLVMEEAHELFGANDEGEDDDSAKMRASLYESMFRRARATGLRLVAITQNCGAIPSAITSQTTTVIVHRTYDAPDRSRICDLFSWDRSIVGQLREIRYLGEMPRGFALVRLDARDSYLQSAPVHILVDPPAIAPATDELLMRLAANWLARRSEG